MADQRITELVAGTGASVAGSDLFTYVDVSDTTMAATGTNKSLTRDELFIALDVLDQPAADLLYATISHTHDAADITTGTLALARMGSGTPAAGKYVDGGTGAWTALPAGGGGSPGGADTQVQFNDGGAFGGDAGLVYNKTTKSLTLGDGSTTGGIKVLNSGGSTQYQLRLQTVGPWDTFRFSYTGAEALMETSDFVPFVLRTLSNNKILFDPGTATVCIGSLNTGFAENATGVLEINNGTKGTFRDLRLRTLVVDSTATTEVTSATYFGAPALVMKAVGAYNVINSDAMFWISASGGGVNKAKFDTLTGLWLPSAAFVKWGDGADVTSSTIDIGLYRNAAGVLEINDGTAGTFRDLKLRTVLAGTWNGTAIAAAYIGTHTHDAADVTTGTFATGRLGTGTARASTALKGDGTWTPATTILYRSADLTMTANSSTALGMSLTYTSGEAWVIHYRIMAQVTGGTAGLKFKLNTLPTGVTGRMRVMGPTTGVGVYSQDQSTTLTTASAGYITASFTGSIDVWIYVTGGSANGTIDLMLTTGASAAGTVFAGTSAQAMRVA